MTLTLTTSSRPRRCEGVSSPSQITVSAPVAATSSRSSWALPLPRNVAGVGVLAALQDAVEHDAARRLGERRQFVQRVLGVVRRAVGPQARQHHALEAQPAVLDLGDVLQLGRQARHAAQRLPVGEVELLAVGGAAGRTVERLPALAGVASEDAPHRGVPRRRVHALGGVVGRSGCRRARGDGGLRRVVARGAERCRVHRPPDFQRNTGGVDRNSPVRVRATDPCAHPVRHVKVVQLSEGEEGRMPDVSGASGLSAAARPRGSAWPPPRCAPGNGGTDCRRAAAARAATGATRPTTPTCCCARTASCSPASRRPGPRCWPARPVRRGAGGRRRAGRAPVAACWPCRAPTPGPGTRPRGHRAGRRRRGGDRRGRARP